MSNKVRPRAEVLAEKRARASVIREWFQDRVAAAQARGAKQRKLAAENPTGGGHGVTVAMRNIKAPEPEYIRKHEHPPARNLRRVGGQVYPRDLRDRAQNEPYINPGRDLKRHRRLRRDYGDE